MKNDKLLQSTLKEIEQQFGKGAIFLLDNKVNIEEGSISTGSIILDKAIGNGYPRGRIIEIYGAESAGKTTLALHAVAEVQKIGGRAAFIDAEHALDINYAKALGINTKELLLAQPDSGEQALSILEALAKTNSVDLVVVDSVAALVPQVELDGEISDHTIGAHARLMSKALRVLVGTIKKSNTTVIFINQLREKVGVIFGNPEITTGGRALRFYASVRLEVRKESLLKDGESNIGLRSKVTVVKNKTNAPFNVAHLDIYFGKGFDYSNEIIEFATNFGIIEKSGSWYSYKDSKLGQGKNQVKEFLSSNAEIYEGIKAETLNKLSTNK